MSSNDCIVKHADWCIRKGTALCCAGGATSACLRAFMRQKPAWFFCILSIIVQGSVLMLFCDTRFPCAPALAGHLHATAVFDLSREYCGLHARRLGVTHKATFTNSSSLTAAMSHLLAADDRHSCQHRLSALTTTGCHELESAIAASAAGRASQG